MTGTELVDKLLVSGTPPDLLTVAKAFAARQEGGGTAEGVLELLESDPRVTEGTVKKAKAEMGFADTPRGFPVRAPAGGATVGGRQYGAGEVIPTELVLAASADERDALRLEGGTPGAKANKSPIPPLKSTPVLVPGKVEDNPHDALTPRPGAEDADKGKDAGSEGAAKGAHGKHK